MKIKTNKVMTIFVSLECVGTAEECKSGLRSGVAEARELDGRLASAASQALVWSRGGGAHVGDHSEMPTGAVSTRISFARL